MRIVHLSDLHILDTRGVPAWRMLGNKRLTGWVNIKLHRGEVHRPEVVEALLDDVRTQGADHVVITGDVTNLALEPEFEAVARALARLGMPASEVSMVPGNHDVYTQGAQRSKRWFGYFREHATSDFEVRGGHVSGDFPFVRVRGPVAFVGVSTAVARIPVVSSGSAGTAQLRALAEALEHPEVRDRVAVVLAHHPIINPPRRLKRWSRGLADAHAFAKAFEARGGVVSLHGHLHRRMHRTLEAGPGHHVDVIGATSASLVDPRPECMGGYNVYDIDADGLRSVHARIWDPERRAVVDGTVPRVAHA